MLLIDRRCGAPIRWLTCLSYILAGRKKFFNIIKRWFRLLSLLYWVDLRTLNKSRESSIKIPQCIFRFFPCHFHNNFTVTFWNFYFLIIQIEPYRLSIVSIFESKMKFTFLRALFIGIIQREKLFYILKSNIVELLWYGVSVWSAQFIVVLGYIVKN